MSLDVGDDNPYADYLSTGSAAKILGVSQPIIHRLFERGDFPTGIQIARYRFVRESEVLELKQSRKLRFT